MAGTPKKRARQQAQSAAEQAERAALRATAAAAAVGAIPEAAAAPSDATRTRARPWQPPPVVSKPPLGTRTREQLDGAQAATLHHLGQLIKPGFILRISRLRPHWAAGWVEDYQLQSPDNLGTMLSYLKDEHGGQFYKLEVLTAGEQLLYVGEQPVAGSPRERGRLLTREAMEGYPERAPRQQTTQQRDAGDIGQFVRLFIDMQRDTSNAQLESVRDMVRETQQGTRELARAVLDSREQSSRKTSLAAQLGEVVEATRAVERVKKAIGAVGVQRAGAANVDDDMHALGKEATRYFLRSAFEGMGRRNTKTPSDASESQPQSRPQGPVGPLRQVQQSRAVGIPEAKASGQPGGKN